MMSWTFYFNVEGEFNGRMHVEDVRVALKEIGVGVNMEQV
jgi:hypothetical protein